jgi:hypothetical protein
MAVYIRITVDGKRVETSAGRECDPAKWNSHAGWAISAKEEIKSLNNYLDSQTSASPLKAYRTIHRKNRKEPLTTG